MSMPQKEGAGAGRGGVELAGVIQTIVCFGCPSKMLQIKGHSADGETALELRILNYLFWSRGSQSLLLVSKQARTRETR